MFEDQGYRVTLASTQFCIYHTQPLPQEKDRENGRSFMDAWKAFVPEASGIVVTETLLKPKQLTRRQTCQPQHLKRQSSGERQIARPQALYGRM